MNGSKLLNKMFDDIQETLQLKGTAYSVSSARDFINKEFQCNHIGKTRRIIINYFQCFCRKLENRYYLRTT